MTPSSLCPVCAGVSDRHYENPKQPRLFRLCRSCRLVFQETLPSPEEERSRYALHRNSREDRGYRQWLETFLAKGVLPWDPGGPVLDFGSGPEPVLSEMLRERGREVFSYDKYFAPRRPREERFGLVLLSEVLEHLGDPAEEFRRIAAQTLPGGRLVLQSSFLRSFAPAWFGSWWYKEDTTHIRFFSASSLTALGEASGWTLLYQDGRSLGVFQKKGPPLRETL